MAGGEVGGVMYGDLRSAYEDSVVPVGSLDPDDHRPSFRTVDELQRARSVDGIKPHTLSEAEQAALAREEAATTDARMYELMRQGEAQQEAHKSWLAKTLALTGVPGAGRL